MLASRVLSTFWGVSPSFDTSQHAHTFEDQYRLTDVDTNLVKYLIYNLISLFFLIFESIVNSIVHHFLSLIHHVILSLKFHCNTLNSWEIHVPIHRSE